MVVHRIQDDGRIRSYCQDRAQLPPIWTITQRRIHVPQFSGQVPLWGVKQPDSDSTGEQFRHFLRSLPAGQQSTRIGRKTKVGCPYLFYELQRFAQALRRLALIQPQMNDDLALRRLAADDAKRRFERSPALLLRLIILRIAM